MAVSPSAPVRVLLWMPRTARIPGGHRVQLDQTAQALRDLGCVVTQAYGPDPPLEGLDVVHGFGLEADEVHLARAAGVPVVLSTIYWDLDYRSEGPPGRPSWRARGGRAWRGGRFALASMRGRACLARACLGEVRVERDLVAAYSAADLLLPNARGEARSIQRELGVSTPSRFVPNGVNPTTFSPGPEPVERRSKVVMAGRIEPHKNQLGLIEALRGSGLPLVIVGPGHPDHPDYLRRCREAGEGWVTFEAGRSHQEMAEAYRDARVHVLPTWFETTGLVSLEAALCGCNIVSTDRGHAREYLGDLAWYCDPGRPASIRQAVLGAWGSPGRPALADRVLARYTWAHAASATLDAYREVLSRRAGPPS